MLENTLEMPDYVKRLKIKSQIYFKILEAYLNGKDAKTLAVENNVAVNKIYSIMRQVMRTIYLGRATENERQCIDAVKGFSSARVGSWHLCKDIVLQILSRLIK